MNASTTHDKSRAETEKELDQALKESFPGSDPVQLTDPSQGLGGAPKQKRPEEQPQAGPKPRQA